MAKQINVSFFNQNFFVFFFAEEGGTKHGHKLSLGTKVVKVLKCFIVLKLLNQI